MLTVPVRSLLADWNPLHHETEFASTRCFSILHPVKYGICYCLYNYDFKENKRLEQVRDLFVFGCLVGLSFSDYSTVEKENIVNLDGDHFLKVIPEQTRYLVIIPCHPLVFEILKKSQNNYNGWPRALSIQKFDEFIKEACEIAGLTEKGRLSTFPKKELYECITSRTARQ
jgi:hypothetical protein